MAAFDGRSLSGASGAVVLMRDPASKTLELSVDRGRATTSKASRALIVTGEGKADANDALDEAVKIAQQALDIWAVKGVMARTLAAVGDGHIVWWRADGRPVCRIWATTHFGVHIEARGEVRDAEGNLVPPTPEPVPDWHPSFRYFRLGQTTTDLVDAFRNYYLALEAVLSTIEPIRLHDDGRPAEREADWLDRALSKAAELVALADYVLTDNAHDPLGALRSGIYVEARNQTFHAKSGAPLLLPHDTETQTLLADAVVRLRRLVVDLATKEFGFQFLGGGGLARAGFEAAVSGMNIDDLYASGDAVEEARIEAGDLPRDLYAFGGSVEVSADDFYASTVGCIDVREAPPVIRQVGTLLKGQIGTYHDLGGAFEPIGFESVYVVVGVAGQNPAALGTRYSS